MNFFIKDIFDFCFIFINRVSHVEEQAFRNLNEKFTANKSRLMKEFRLKDPNVTGKNFFNTKSKYEKNFLLKLDL